MSPGSSTVSPYLSTALYERQQGHLPRLETNIPPARCEMSSSELNPGSYWSGTLGGLAWLSNLAVQIECICLNR